VTKIIDIYIVKEKAKMIIESLNFKIIAIQVGVQEVLSNHILQVGNIQVLGALLNFGVNT
jgi:hypothetical protein